MKNEKFEKIQDNFIKWFKFFLKKYWRELILILAVYLIFLNVKIPSGYDEHKSNGGYYFYSIKNEQNIRDLVYSGSAKKQDSYWWVVDKNYFVLKAHLKSITYVLFVIGILLLINKYKKSSKETLTKKEIESKKKSPILKPVIKFDISPIKSLVMNNFKGKLNNIEGFSSLILEGCYGGITPEIKKVIIKINKSGKELIEVWTHAMEEIRQLERAQASSFRIMHFEDDKFLGEIYRKKLEEAGFVIKSLTQPDEDVLKSIESFNPDLIITDILMPEINGYQLIEKIRKNEKFDNIPIVGFSNLDKKETLTKVLDLGGNDYWVVSEHSPIEIIRKIKRILEIK